MVVQRSKFKDLHALDSSPHTFSAHRGATNRTCGRDDGCAAHTTEKCRRSTDTHGTQSRTDTSTDHRSKQTSRQANDQTTADGGEAHHHEALVSRC